MNLKPLKNGLILRRVKANDTSDGGIIIPDKAKKQQYQGRVLEIGKEVEQVKRGDIVIFASFANSEFELACRKFVIIKEDDVLALVKDDKEKE